VSTPREQYEAMLDELDDCTKMRMLDHIPFARLLEDADPTTFRCGLADFEPQCDKCGEPYTADDEDADAICPECVEAMLEDEDEDDTPPPCAQAMNCLCAAHAKGRASEGPCDTNEGCDPERW
jgi:hypothetical protein